MGVFLFRALERVYLYTCVGKADRVQSAELMQRYRIVGFIHREMTLMVCY